MIALMVDAPFATFRKSFSRSYAETYPLPPPATVYGMLLSLVGEKYRTRHEGVRMAFAYGEGRKIAATLKRLSRYKYSVPGKQQKEGIFLDYIEVLCNINFLCWIDSACEKLKDRAPTLEERILEALEYPERVARFGVVSLGLSDDLVNDIRLYSPAEDRDRNWCRLIPRDDGTIELPVWVNHVSGFGTEWRRFVLDEARVLDQPPGTEEWPWISIERAGDISHARSGT